MKPFRFILFFGCFCFVLVTQQNCAEPTNNVSQNSTVAFSPFSNSANYFQKTPLVTVEVFYETGAEPYVGTTASGRPYWTILADNLTTIFQYRSSPPQLDVPQSLANMTSLGAIGDLDWTTSEILNLNINHRAKLPSETDSRFYVYFLNGYYNDGTQRLSGVIGVSLGGTPIIAIFKPVVKSAGANPAGPVPRFVEQSTLVHEMGHALGFVNNGIPMATNHQDSSNGAHSTDPDCVMYYLNEGLTDLSNFIQKFLTTSSVVMWGPKVLQDAQSFSR